MAELLFDLQMFADGSAPGGSEGASTGETAEAPTAQGVTAEAPAADDRQAAYAKFKADFDAEFKTDVENMVKGRLKKSKAQEAQAKAQASDLQGTLDKLTPMFDLLSAKYGVDADDLDGLVRAIEDDDRFYEDEAYEHGMTTEQWKAFLKLKRDNKALQRQTEAMQQAEQHRQWDQQFAELLQVYPNVDPNEEIQNKDFWRLMTAGMNVRDVYEWVHRDELQRGAMQFTANKVAEKMANAAIANNAQPRESGTSPQAAAVTQPNIASMTREQLLNDFKRAKAGAKINYVDKF